MNMFISEQRKKFARIMYSPVGKDKPIGYSDYYKEYPNGQYLRLLFNDLPKQDPQFILKAYIPILCNNISLTIEYALRAQIESVFDPWDIIQKPNAVHVELFQYEKRGEITAFDPSIMLLFTSDYIARWAHENMVDRREKYIKSKVRP